MKPGNLTSWNPLGHSRLVTGLLYLYLYYEKLTHSSYQMDTKSKNKGDV
jgi:hypothetical protein